MSLSKTLLPVPLRPSTASVSPRFTVQTDPIQNLVAAERLAQVLNGDNGRMAVLPGVRWVHRDVISCGHVVTPVKGSLG